MLLVSIAISSATDRLAMHLYCDRTAGGFKAKGAGIGDAYLVTGAKHHDRRIPIPGFTEYGIGDHTATPTPNLVAALGYKTGVVTTGNSLDHTPKDDELMTANDASVKDMEAAAIAWAAELTATPFIALKVVTDIVDGDRPTQEEFFENLGAAARSLQDAVPKVVDFIVGKRLSEL
jgi:5'-methylthioadenosine nucleosidase